MIHVIDYGLGNVQAFLTLYKHLGIKAHRAKTAADLINVKKIILPGVGAFDHAMTLLNQSGMRPPQDVVPTVLYVPETPLIVPAPVNVPFMLTVAAPVVVSRAFAMTVPAKVRPLFILIVPPSAAEIVATLVPLAGPVMVTKPFVVSVPEPISILENAPAVPTVDTAVVVPIVTDPLLAEQSMEEVVVPAAPFVTLTVVVTDKRPLPISKVSFPVLPPTSDNALVVKLVSYPEKSILASPPLTAEDPVTVVVPVTFNTAPLPPEQVMVEFPVFAGAFIVSDPAFSLAVPFIVMV